MAQNLAPYIDSFIWAEAIQVAKRNCREMEGMACFQFLPAFHSLLNLSLTTLLIKWPGELGEIPLASATFHHSSDHGSTSTSDR